MRQKKEIVLILGWQKVYLSRSLFACTRLPIWISEKSVLCLYIKKNDLFAFVFKKKLKIRQKYIFFIGLNVSMYNINSKPCEFFEFFNW